MEFPPGEIRDIIDEIAHILRTKNYTLAVSEAACGGLISAYLISVPGASDFYIGGKLVYSLKQRLRLSGWSADEIRHYMGPSEVVALRLARTTKYELGSTFVLSETGFAGPTVDLHLTDGGGTGTSAAGANASGTTVGASAGPGDVYLGFVGPDRELSCKRQTHSANRSQNMTEFARFGLEFLLDQLRSL
ncbi:hypothetical protein PSN45_003960 [Yamadazyma tenuis]|uniref:CinA C-terminal domain-containing protein n=1 Tax=Candida tenuis (strain ATCC 10573 / BCRC 21748 / CBS 615 / JCM 9827 / NBRC 10315 / NRRL Y-1498 / VKM Y-70) TaxID=590646 RepID=G3B4J9_CANTC|nr:uncharacterized protein CANTEDRAFT_113999 [Yamadazyma tenuis ATCC 10573]EGV64303.1 hypothetical protein CANTEDRAFT_113999 [Yamadazyma tenuis ATCC 10573]WEJ96421.1 hypothetical protein PSN45_003960 [Yamadazyma tenuis]